jgi:hypothetical protein
MPRLNPFNLPYFSGGSPDSFSARHPPVGPPIAMSPFPFSDAEIPKRTSGLVLYQLNLSVSTDWIVHIK